MTTSFFTIASPRPVPCHCRASVRLPSCENGSNACSRNSSLIPIPLSRTVKRTHSTFPSVRSLSVRSHTFPPSGVYFAALDSRLKKICLNRTASVYIISSICCRSHWNVMFFCSISGPIVVLIAVPNVFLLICSDFRFRLPLSMREISSISLISPRRNSLEDLILSRYPQIVSS